jgi:hypothetical protein
LDFGPFKPRRRSGVASRSFGPDRARTLDSGIFSFGRPCVLDPGSIDFRRSWIFEVGPFGPGCLWRAAAIVFETANFTRLRLMSRCKVRPSTLVAASSIRSADPFQLGRARIALYEFHLLAGRFYESGIDLIDPPSAIRRIDRNAADKRRSRGKDERRLRVDAFDPGTINGCLDYLIHHVIGRIIQVVIRGVIILVTRVEQKADQFDGTIRPVGLIVKVVAVDMFVAGDENACTGIVKVLAVKNDRAYFLNNVRTVTAI